MSRNYTCWCSKNRFHQPVKISEMKIGNTIFYYITSYFDFDHIQGRLRTNDDHVLIILILLRNTRILIWKRLLQLTPSISLKWQFLNFVKTFQTTFQTTIYSHDYISHSADILSLVIVYISSCVDQSAICNSKIQFVQNEWYNHYRNIFFNQIIE